MKWALYQLRQGPSFDFLTFMQSALDRGAEGVWLLNGFAGWHGYGGREGEEKRIETIVKPIIQLYRLEMMQADEGPKEECVWPEEGMKTSSHLMRHMTLLKRCYPLPATPEALDKTWDLLGGRKRIVVPLRQCKYQEGRNTGEGMIRWSKDHDAYIIPDDLTVSLDERVAFYEHAEVVIGVGGGNLMPAVYSHRPFIVQKQIVSEYKATTEDYYRKQNMPVGFQFPWASPKQLIMWDLGDSYEDTEKAYKRWLEST